LLPLFLFFFVHDNLISLNNGSHHALSTFTLLLLLKLADSFFACFTQELVEFLSTDIAVTLMVRINKLGQMLWSKVFFDDQVVRRWSLIAQFHLLYILLVLLKLLSQRIHICTFFLLV
jgi:hypothetical protein